MGEAAEEDYSAGCSLSLMCLEDGSDLDAAAAAAGGGGGGSAESADDGNELAAAFLYSVPVEEQDQEEYMDHLVSKESSFCCSPSSSSSPSPSASPVFSDTADPEPCPWSTASSDEWFRCARRDTVQWIFQVMRWSVGRSIEHDEEEASVLNNLPFPSFSDRTAGAICTLQTRAYFGFSHRTAYLAVSYMDRFCLHRFMDRSVMPWAARLLAVACVSLAAKMEEYRAPALPEFRADDDEYDFSSASIRRMELLVLSTLGWRMGHVTPLDYLPCLSSRLRPVDGGGGGSGLVAAKAAALIFSAAEAASVLDYRPSTVAVAAVLAAAHGAMTREALEARMSSLSLSPPGLLDKDDVVACYTAMLSESSSSATPRTSTLAANKTPPPPSSSSTTYESIDAASSLATAAERNKRARLELAAVVGP